MKEFNRAKELIGNAGGRSQGQHIREGPIINSNDHGGIKNYSEENGVIKLPPSGYPLCNLQNQPQKIPGALLLPTMLLNPFPTYQSQAESSVGLERKAMKRYFPDWPVVVKER